MKYRVLSVDVRLRDKRIENSFFSEASAFSDYDVVVIDPESVSSQWYSVKSGKNGGVYLYSDSDGGLGRQISQLIQRRAEETELLLQKIGGVLICFLRGQGQILERRIVRGYAQYDSQYIHRYSWIPRITFTKSVQGVSREIHFPGWSRFIYPRKGRSIPDVDFRHPFSQYFEGFRGQTAFEVVVKLGELEEFSSVIARNRAGEVVAFENFHLGRERWFSCHLQCSQTMRILRNWQGYCSIVFQVFFRTRRLPVVLPGWRSTHCLVKVHSRRRLTI